ncbi:MAG: hypothetical protein M3446_01465 [Actinomycetota bacterium]|nr:hypothetical protein [Geodermatophilaceae bacterium]MDQ3504359.1 hypothetical protein [Actinomycetota bacterium]
MSAGLSWPTALWLAVRGGRSDVVRIALTAAGSAAGMLALLSAATVISIGPDDGPYSNQVLAQPGLHQGVVAALVLLCIPVLAFVGQCSRIGAPARDRRLAAVRLAGGTPRDVTRVACGEVGISSGVGAAAGLVLYLIGRVVLGDPVVGTYGVRTEVQVSGGMNVTEEVFTGPVLRLPTDVLPPIWAIAALLVAVPLGAMAFTGLALRGVTISPFGVIRHRRITPPRLLPAAAFIFGVLALASFTTITSNLDSDLGGLAELAFPIVVGLFLITSAGLVLGSASLAAGIGGFLAGRSGRPALLIAARRLSADPFAASRAFGAVLLTVLVGAGAQGVRAFTLAGTNPDDPFYADTLDLVNLVIAVAVVVAALGLLVVAAEGILTRRQSLAALTAAGTPVGVLRRAVLAEVLLPLVPTALLAASAGTLAARGLFGTTFVNYEYSASGQATERIISVPIPWAELGILVAGTLVVTLLVSSLALLFLRASIDPAELRAAA